MGSVYLIDLVQITRSGKVWRGPPPQKEAALAFARSRDVR